MQGVIKLKILYNTQNSIYKIHVFPKFPLEKSQSYINQYWLCLF